MTNSHDFVYCSTTTHIRELGKYEVAKIAAVVVLLPIKLTHFKII